MLTHISERIREVVRASTIPVLCLVVAEGCENVMPIVQAQLEQELTEKRYNVQYLSFCVSENEMPFPRFSTPTLYFFIPKNETPIFHRNFVFQTTLNDDVLAAFKMMQGVSLDQARFTTDQLQQIQQVENILEEEQETLSSYPSSFQMARNLAKEVWKTGKRAAKGLPVLVDTQTGYSRLSTCEACPRYDAEKSRCLECGCFMKTKTQLASASCPLHKW